MYLKRRGLNIGLEHSDGNVGKFDLAPNLGLGGLARLLDIAVLALCLLVLDRDLLLLVLLLSMVLKATRRGAALVDWNLAALIGDLGLLRNLRHIDGKDALVPVALELVQLGLLW